MSQDASEHGGAPGSEGETSLSSSMQTSPTALQSPVGFPPVSLPPAVVESPIKPLPGVVETLDAEAAAAREAEWTGPTAFRKREGARGLSPIHSATKPLLQRQFLESIVRLGIARFPNELGLECQAQRLFKERIQPGIGKVHGSDITFSCLVDSDARAALDEFEPMLGRLFRGPPPPADDAQKSVTSTSPASPSAPGREAAAIAAALQAAGLPAELANLQCMRKYGDYCSVQRNYHLRGRLDQTVRVKDVLILLERAGLIAATSHSAFPIDDPFEHIFAAKMAEEANEAEADKDAEGGSSGQLPIDLAEVPPEFPTEAEILGDAIDGTVAMSAPSAEAPAAEAAGQEALESTTPKEKPLTAADFASCDMRVGLLDVLRFLTEVGSPGSEENIRLRLNPEDVCPRSDILSLLEYAETELIYSELERLVTCIALLATSRDKELCNRLTMAKRLGGFLRYVLMPAMVSGPYAPQDPSAASAEGAAAEGASEAAPAAEAPAAEPEAADADAANQDMLSFWQGFDDSSVAHVEAALCTRRWLSGYEHDVADW